LQRVKLVFSCNGPTRALGQGKDLSEFAAGYVRLHYKSLSVADCLYDLIYLVFFCVFVMTLSFAEIISHQWHRNKM
jgi:hypothetical protein